MGNDTRERERGTRTLSQCGSQTRDCTRFFLLIRAIDNNFTTGKRIDGRRELGGDGRRELEGDGRAREGRRRRRRWCDGGVSLQLLAQGLGRVRLHEHCERTIRDFPLGRHVAPWREGEQSGRGKVRLRRDRACCDLEQSLSPHINKISCNLSYSFLPSHEHTT